MKSYALFESINIGYNEYIREPISKDFAFEDIEQAKKEALKRLHSLSNPIKKSSCLVAVFRDGGEFLGSLYKDGFFTKLQ